MSARVELYREILAGQMAVTAVFGHDTAAEIAKEQPGTSLGKWRWRFVASNGRILADSGQGYTRRIDCINGCAAVLGGVTVGRSGISTFQTEIEPSTLVAKLRLLRIVDLTREGS